MSSSGIGTEEGVMISQSTFSQNLFALESSKDLTIVVGNGTELKCHSIIFSAHSPVLGAMVSSTNGMLESRIGRVEMRENSEVGMNILLRYLYGFRMLNAELTSEVAVELFETAHQYELTQLENHIRELFMNKGEEWYGPDDILELYFYVKDMDGLQPFRDHILSVMTRIPEQLQSCIRYKELARDEVHHLLWKLFEAKGAAHTDKNVTKREVQPTTTTASSDAPGPIYRPAYCRNRRNRNNRRVGGNNGTVFTFGEGGG